MSEVSNINDAHHNTSDEDPIETKDLLCDESIEDENTDTINNQIEYLWIQNDDNENMESSLPSLQKLAKSENEIFTNSSNQIILHSKRNETYLNYFEVSDRKKPTRSYAEITLHQVRFILSLSLFLYVIFILSLSLSIYIYIYIEIMK